jgi:selenocysteine lyase/cysteine desulfurase
MVRFEDDLYVIDKIYQSYLKDYWNEVPVDMIHFNHASITPPLPSIHQAATDIYEERLHLNSCRRLKIIEEARRKVSALVNLKEESVAFANNTTDATSLVFWLTGLRKGDSVITTDAENESIPRIFKYYMDHANPGDGWVSWQNFAQYSNSEPGLIKKKRTGVKVKMVKAYDFDYDTFMESLMREIDKSTKLVVFCHVLRENGRIMPVSETCKTIHDAYPNMLILVDGAQCLGTMPKIDFQELGCDFYVATPHKTLCSETVGLLFIHPKHLTLSRKLDNVTAEKQIIKKDQFSSRLEVKPNSGFAVSLPEIYALSLVIDYYEQEGWLRGNDFSRVDHHLGTLKKASIARLDLQNVKIISPISSEFTNFICSFRFQSLNNRELARQLWNEGIFVSYIHRSNIVRTSFSITNNIEQVDRFDITLKRLVANRGSISSG